MASVSQPLPADRQYLLRMAAWRTNACFAVTPFADVVEEYQQYRESEAWHVMRHSGRNSVVNCRRPRHFPGTFTGAQRLGRYSTPETGITDGEFRQLATQLSGVQRTDLHLRWQPCGWGDCATAWTTLRIYLYASTGLGGADGYRTRANVLPLGIHIAAQETLPQLATDWQHN